MENFNSFKKKKIRANLEPSLSDRVVLKIFSTVDSTNDQAKKLINSISENKAAFSWEKTIVVVADSQSAGRGRRGHSWFSDDPAGLAVSFVFKAPYNISQIPQITAAAGLAVNDTLKKFKLEGQLKWPNDILVDQKKIAGILSELVLNKEKDAFLIIGCGINLNNSHFDSEIRKKATSYYLEKKEKIDKNLFLTELLKKMNYYIKSYFKGNRDQIIEKWKKELNLKEKKIDLKYKGENYTAVIEEILASGELLIKLPDGKEKIIQSLNSSLDYQSLKKYN